MLACLHNEGEGEEQEGSWVLGNEEMVAWQTKITIKSVATQDLIRMTSEEATILMTVMGTAKC